MTRGGSGSAPKNRLRRDGQACLGLLGGAASLRGGADGGGLGKAPGVGARGGLPRRGLGAEGQDGRLGRLYAPVVHAPVADGTLHARLGPGGHGAYLAPGCRALRRPDGLRLLPGLGRGRLRGLQRAAHGVVHGVIGPPLVREAHLGLGGVDVHVHRRGGELYIQHAGREAAREHGAAVGLLQRRLQQLGAYGPAVAEEILRRAVPPRERGLRHEAAHPERPVLQLHLQHRGGELPAQQGVDRAVAPPVAGGEELLAPVPNAAEADVRTAQGAAQGRLHAGRALGPVRLHELQPRGRVVEEAPDYHRRALRAARLVHVRNFARVQLHAHAEPRAALAA